MSALRCVLLVVLLTVVACASSAVPDARAAPEVVISDGGFMDVAIDPGSGRSVAISSDLAPGSRPGNMTMRLYATALDPTGRPAGTANLFGDGFSPDFMGPHLISVATDVRRGRHLVAYTATKPGMGSSSCEPLPVPPPGAIVFPADTQRECATLDQEIFVRVLDRAGRSVGPERQITSIGPPASGMFRSGAPNVAFDARSDSYVVVFSALLTGDQQASALLSQRLRADGAPLGAPRRLALQSEPLAYRPQAALLADPRGGSLLVYLWGQGGQQRLYARRMRSDGAVQGPTSVLTGTGIGSFEVDFDRRRRRALVVYTRGGGVEDGIRARLLGADGRPLAEPANLPYRIGAGAISVASDNDSGRWLYGFVREGKALERQAFVQSADSHGRPEGPARALSPDSNSSAAQPLLTAGRRGTVLARWFVAPIVCDSGGGCTTGSGNLHLRLIRP